MSEGLCWECKGLVRKSFPISNPELLYLEELLEEILHCHHKPEEKPKCEECQDGVLAPLYRPVRLNASIKTSNFCPQCGRKL